MDIFVAFWNRFFGAPGKLDITVKEVGGIRTVIIGVMT